MSEASRAGGSGAHTGERVNWWRLLAHVVAFCVAAAIGGILVYPSYPRFEAQTDTAGEAFWAFLTYCVIAGGIGPLIGYVEYGFAKRLGLPMAVLQNKSGSFVEPNLAAGQSALSEAAAASPKTLAALDSSIVDPSGSSAYPIVTFSWLLLYRQYADPAKGDAIRNFVAWGLSSGQSFDKDLGYIPLPDKVAMAGRQALAEVGH